MHVRLRFLAAGFAAALLFALGVGAAAASRSFSVVGGGRAIQATSLSGLTFSTTSGTTFIVDATLHGSIHPLLPKARGSLAGLITSVLTANCLNSFFVACSIIGLPPWHLRAASFTGTLPRITSVLLDAEAALRFVFERTDCLYRGNLGLSLSGTAGPAEFTWERAGILAGFRFPLVEVKREEIIRHCGNINQILGGFRFTPLVTVRLH